jgi:hypothetical protein
MKNIQGFDEQLRSELILKATEIEPTEELQSRIFEDFMDQKNRNTIMVRNKLYNIGVTKTAAALLCLTLGIGTIAFSVSQPLQSFAATVASSIKTVFVVNGTKDNYTVSEKPVEEVLQYWTRYNFTNSSDEELSKLVGFKVALPETVGANLNLKNKRKGVSLHKIDYKSFIELQDDIEKAIDDDVSFNNLIKYQPKRVISGMYFNGTSALNLDLYNSYGHNEYKGSYDSIVDINGIKGYWQNSTHPLYPNTNIGTKPGPDMTKKPTEVINEKYLIWVKNDIIYRITVYRDGLSNDEIVNAAKNIVDYTSKQ